MLSNVHVKNFALIDEADIGLDNHLNILTGETGAGKSILLGAINLALGARTSKDVVRSSAEYALAELTFTEVSPGAVSAARELGIDCDDDEIVISRKLMSNGRSVVRINGETMNSAAARTVTSELIDIYGQNEHQSLTDTSRHLEIVDRFLGPEAVTLKSQIAGEYADYAALMAERSGMETDPLKRTRRIDLLTSEIREIEQAQLKEGEEEALKAERRILANAALIREALGQTISSLYDEGGASDMLSNALKALGRVGELDENLGTYLDELAEVDLRVSDIYREISDYLDSMPDSEERLNEVDSRLELISDLKRKYGSTVAEIYEFCESERNTLQKLTEFETYLEKLEGRISAAERQCLEHSAELSRLRAEAAQILKNQISKALLELNFNQVRFDIQFARREGLHADGIDTCEFVISLNPGEELKSLARIASGGEMSRIMLAIKSVFARRETIGTLIFDEIDAGISGITAQKVADKLCTIASERQVICITHLPQIAAMADAHFKVEKHVADGCTMVSIKKADEQTTIAELGRILGGESLSETVMEAAQDIRQKALKRQKELRCEA